MASRRKARILAFQALYAWDASSMPLEELLDFSWVGEDSSALADEEVTSFARLMTKGAVDNIGEVDAAISRHLEHWSFERLKKVDLAILRASVYSLLFQGDIPGRITIDEAIELAKEFGSEDSYRFVNGVLDAVWKELAKG